MSLSYILIHVSYFSVVTLPQIYLYCRIEREQLSASVLFTFCLIAYN